MWQLLDQLRNVPSVELWMLGVTGAVTIITAVVVTIVNLKPSKKK